MSIILGNGGALKDLHIGNKIIKEVHIGNKLVYQQSWPGLKFTSQQDNSTVGYTTSGTVNKDIYTSTDGKTWTPWNGSNITLNQGDSIYVWNKTNTLNGFDSYLQFTMSGSIEASGNVNSMINFSELSGYCYYALFKDCTALITAPALPATTLDVGCYNSMFKGCTALTTAPPDLPATTLADGCYKYMFEGCTSLTTAPDLPATTLADDCYNSMFKGCTALITAPALPATTLADGCYKYMFKDCTSLTTAPDLPATTLADGCYKYMFKDCTSLNSIKLSYTGNFLSQYFYYWAHSISSNGNLYYNGSDTTRGSSAIPQNWAVHTFTP